MKLVHHTDESRNGGASPFAEAIRELTASKYLSLTCPYINVEYLRSVLEHASSWRLVTDVKAWLGSQNAGKRELVREFIEQHHENIHHVEDLHAKAIVGDDSALVGSANFTEKGLWKREELSVFLDESESIEELRVWFDGLWTKSDPVEFDELDAYIRTAPATPSGASRGNTPSFTSNAPKVRASRTADASSEHGGLETVEDEDAYERLVGGVRDAPSREWIDDHFDLLEGILSVTDISVHDPILFMSITKSGKIHTTINNRIVFGIQPFRNRTLFILSSDTKQIDRLITEAIHSERFKDRDKDTPYLLGFNNGIERVTDPSFKRGWIKAALTEMDRGWDESPYRNKYTHQPIVYRAAVDHEYRERLLDEAFGASHGRLSSRRNPQY